MRLANAHTLWKEDTWEKEAKLPHKYSTEILKAPTGYRVLGRNDAVRIHSANSGSERLC